MAYTSADLANVEKAILDLAGNKRQTRVVIDGDVVEYSTVDLPQLRALRREIATELDTADPNTNTSRVFSVVGGKGL